MGASLLALAKSIYFIYERNEFDAVPNTLCFALVSLNDPHRFSTILVFISALKYPITVVSIKTLLTVLM